MDISALSISMNQINTNNDVGVAVLAKNLETMKTEGENMTKMMEASVYPNLGQNIDYSV